MRHKLEVSADRIEALFAQHNVKAKVWGGMVLPRLVRYHVVIPSWQKLRALTALTDEMALALSVPSVRIYRVNGMVALEVPRDKPEAAVALSQLEKKVQGKLPPFSAVLGIDQDGLPLVVRVTASTVVHTLIVGTTGSGKSVLQRAMVASLMHHNQPDALRFVLIDPKGGRSLSVFESDPHVIGPAATNVDDAYSALRWLVEQMEVRDAEHRSTPVVVIAIDEVADLIMQYPAVLQLMTRITQRGREAGLHMLAATQRPDSAVMSGLLKSNFPLRLVGRVSTANDSVVSTGRRQADAHMLLGKGDFLAVSDTLVRFQAAMRDEEIYAVDGVVNATGRVYRATKEA